MQLADYIALVRRSWLLILACTVIGAALGATLALLTPQRYDATAQLYVSVRGTGAASELAQGNSFARQALSSYVEVIPTAIVLEPVIDHLGLDATVTQVADRITASTPMNSQVLSITASDATPSEAAQLANAVGESFTRVVADELERPTVEGEESKVRVETISQARVPTTPSAPNLRLNLLLGLLVGLAAGVALAVLRAVLDTRVHTADDVESVLESPILGAIAHDPDAPKRPLIVDASPRDPRAEAFRRVRTNLQFLALDSGVPAFVFTAAAPGDGKSTTAANVALAIAETGARVALIDADMRRPGLADLFGIDGAVGLSDVLVGRAPVSTVLQQWGRGRLFLLPAGMSPPNPSELLGSRTMAETLTEMRAAFDVIIIDAPPLLAVTDAAVVGRHATGAIVIAASGYTRKPQLESAAKALAAADVALLGAVVTKVPTRGPDSYGYGAYTYGVTHADVS